MKNSHWTMKGSKWIRTGSHLAAVPISQNIKNNMKFLSNVSIGFSFNVILLIAYLPQMERCQLLATLEMSRRHHMQSGARSHQELPPVLWEGYDD